MLLLSGLRVVDYSRTNVKRLAAAATPALEILVESFVKPSLRALATVPMGI